VAQLIVAVIIGTDAGKNGDGEAPENNNLFMTAITL
jgi:hypothetical protein